VSFQFEHFKDQWIEYGDFLNPFLKSIDFTVRLPVEFFDKLRFDDGSLAQYRVNAALSAASMLGEKPVLCLSGGIDSQAMIQCWKEANLDFDIATLVFNAGLNAHDVDHARLYCQSHGLSLIELQLNIPSFLVRDSAEVADLYQCSSPHFITHYKMFDMLIDLGYTGICCGGQAFAKGKDQWGPAPSAAQINYIEFARKREFPVMGNFLGHTPELCWAIAILTPNHAHRWNMAHSESSKEIHQDRYNTKVEGYRRAGFDIIPQDQKYTGFELVKNYFAEHFNDGWAFEKKFRLPLQRKYASSYGELVLTKEQLDCIEKLYAENFTATGSTFSRITV
jgi:hypothetical protein